MGGTEKGSLTVFVSGSVRSVFRAGTEKKYFE